MNTKVILSVLVLAVILSVGGILMLRQSLPSQPGILEGWTVYRSEALGIEFEYPREYYEIESLKDCGPQESSDSLGGHIWVDHVQIGRMNRGDTTLSEFIQRFDGSEGSPYPYIWIANRLESVTTESLQIVGAPEALKVFHPIDPSYIGTSSRLFSGTPRGITVFATTENDDIILIRVHDQVVRCGIEGKNTFERILASL